MAISQDYLAELSRRTDITELVRSYVELKRAGRMEKGLCPFHNEKTPSFYVYPETESFYCFGCGAGGDAITFVKRIMNLDYVEAVKFLASRAGMPLPDEDDSAAKRRGRLLGINREAARFFFARLNTDEGQNARAYLRGRGLSDATIRRFGVGYAPDAFGELRNHLKGQGYSEEELVEAGVCKRSAKGGVYDSFRNRVIFPIIDLRGNVIAFGGRVMGQEAGPKYLNSAETPVFHKSRNLFALNIARKGGEKRLILAEGYMDVISLHQAGFTTAVATLGTALTDEQARLIADYAEEVVICYDSDDAGQRATARAINAFRNTPVKVRVLALEGAKDPDEFISRFGVERFRAMLEGSGNTVEYALARLKKDYDIASEDGRVAYAAAALELLAREATPVEQGVYLGRVANETAIERDRLATQMDAVLMKVQRQNGRRRRQRMLQESKAAAIDVPYAARGERALGVVYSEQVLVGAMLRNPQEVIPAVAKEITPEQMISPEMAEAYLLLLQMHGRGEHIDLAAMAGRLSEKGLALLSKVIAQNYDVGCTLEDIGIHLERLMRERDAAADVTAMPEEDYRDFIERKRRQKGGG